MIATTEPIVIMTRAELDAMLKQVATEAATQALSLTTSSDSDDALWDAEACGKYLGISAWTWANEWSHRRGAPMAMVMGDGPKAKRRWVSGEVKDWALRQRKAA